jgi:2-iminobutanoate/2-iminopropanoate deaminase
MKKIACLASFLTVYAFCAPAGAAPRQSRGAASQSAVTGGTSLISLRQTDAPLLPAGHSVVNTLNAPTPGSYSQARIVDLGDRIEVHTSGMTGNNPKAKDEGVVRGGIEPQTRRALKNIKAVVQAAGGNIGHIVKTTVYMTNLAGNNAGFEAAYKAFFDGYALPARSKVGVADIPLASEPTVVMIDAVAVISKK